MLQVSIKSIVIMSPSVGIRRHSWRLLGKIEVSSHSQFQFNRHHQRLKHDNKIVIKVFKTSPCVLSTEDAASWMTVTKEVCKLWTLSNCYNSFFTCRRKYKYFLRQVKKNHCLTLCCFLPLRCFLKLALLVFLKSAAEMLLSQQQYMSMYFI